MTAVTKTLSLVRVFLQNCVAILARRKDGASTSPFGILLQLLGVGSGLYGLYLYAPPLAFVVGGLLAIYVGEHA